MICTLSKCCGHKSRSVRIWINLPHQDWIIWIQPQFNNSDPDLDQDPTNGWTENCQKKFLKFTNIGGWKLLICLICFLKVSANIWEESYRKLHFWVKVDPDPNPNEPNLLVGAEPWWKLFEFGSPTLTKMKQLSLVIGQIIKWSNYLW